MDIKKFNFVIILFFAVLLCQGNAEAVFSITLNYFSIDFGNMDSGYSGSFQDDVPSNGLVVTCTTDQGLPWSLMIRNDYPLTNTSNPSSMIPDTNFKWYGVSTNGAGTLISSREDFTIPRTVYTSSGGEGAAGIDITMKFELTLPPLLQSGTYDTNIVFTLTE